MKCHHEGCAGAVSARFYWPTAGSRVACPEHARAAVDDGRRRGWLITLHPWPELCGQQGDTVTPERGHVPGECTYPPGHDGPHSWELEP